MQAEPVFRGSVHWIALAEDARDLNFSLLRRRYAATGRDYYYDDSHDGCQVVYEESTVRFGSVAVVQTISPDRLLSGAYQPLRLNFGKSTILNVCFHQ